MAGTLVITTLSDGTNSTSSTNCIQGSAKAWVNFAGASGTVNGSYNVSSVTRSGVGLYTVTFTNALANANYAVGGFGRNSGGTARQIVCQTSASSSYTTTALGVVVGDSGGLNDITSVSVAVFN
jgi:hypothetical protein